MLFDNSGVKFSLVQSDSYEIQRTSEPQNNDRDIIIAIVTFLSICTLIGIYNFMYSNFRFIPNCLGCNRSDDILWHSVIIWGLQCYDFFSDILFIFEANNESN